MIEDVDYSGFESFISNNIGNTITSTSLYKFPYLNSIIDDFDSFIQGGKNGRIIAKMSKSSSVLKSITLFDNKLNKIGTITITLRCEKIFFYVTSDDLLVVVTDTGFICTYSHLILQKITDFSSHTIKNCGFWDKGCCLIDETNITYLSYNFDKPQEYVPLFTGKEDLDPERTIQNIVDTGPDVIPSVLIIPPEQAKDGKPIIFCNSLNNILYVASQSISDVFVSGKRKNYFNCFKTKFPAPIQFMEISPDYSMIAFFLSDYSLIVTTNNLQNTLLTANLDDDSPVFSLAWCGSEAPVVSRHGEADVIMSDGSAMPIFIEGTPLLFTSNESVNVYTQEEILNVYFVPECYQKLTLNTPSGKLVDYFIQKNYYELNQMRINNILYDAILNLLECSKRTCDTNLQKLFLLSADFGRCYINDSEKSIKLGKLFEEIIKKMRIINNLWNEINSFIEFSDFQDPNLSLAIISRIARARKYSLSAGIAEMLSLSKAKMLEIYFLDLVISSKDDEQILPIIKEKITSDFDIVSFEQQLIYLKREQLAYSVAELSFSYDSTTSFLLNQKEWFSALKTAYKSHDTFLFCRTVESIKKEINENQFHSVVCEDPNVLRFYLRIYPNESEQFLLPDEIKEENKQIYFSDAISKLSKDDSLENAEKTNDYLAKLCENDKNQAALQMTEFFYNSKKQQNKIIKKKDIEECDTLNDAIRQLVDKDRLQDAFDLAKSVKLPKEEVVVIALKNAIKNNKIISIIHSFKDKKYSKYWTFIVAFLCVNENRDKANEFIHLLPQGNEKLELEELIKDQQFPFNKIGDSKLYKFNIFPSSTFPFL